MTSFKTFLAETAVKTTPQYKVHPLDDVIKILKSKCSKNLWMISDDRPIYRGDWYVNQIPGGKEAAQKADTAFTVDTSATQRKSTNTYNFYTENVKNFANSEVWIGGDIVMFGDAVWKELQDRMGGEE